MLLQSAIRFLYPPQCLACTGETEKEFALCGSCWQETQFISGLVCDACGVPLPGESPHQAIYCDSCLFAPKSWKKGRAAILYGGVGRALILRLKHGDRLDLAGPLSGWMYKSAAPLIACTDIIVPVPLHWRRLFSRRYNQSALLAQGLAARANKPTCPDVLQRCRNTKIQEGMSGKQREKNMSGAISVHPKRRNLIQGRSILLIDDVMTSGATLSACAEALMQNGANTVNVAVLARVARDT